MSGATSFVSILQQLPPSLKSAVVIATESKIKNEWKFLVNRTNHFLNCHNCTC